MDRMTAATIYGVGSEVSPAPQFRHSTGGHGLSNGAGPAAGASPEPGSILFGEYEIVEGPLGGGMGHVYRCRHRSMGGWRAVKMIRPELLGNNDVEQLFVREAQALADIQHEAVVRCHDLLRDGGRLFLVMEFVEGESLGDLLAHRRLSPDEVMTLGARIASGLAAAHARGVVHRDISPDNIILPQGRVELAKLIDFGVASAPGSGGKTSAIDFKGKLAYASPEQFGVFGTEITGRSDIYSLGMVLAEAAAGASLPCGQTICEAVALRRTQPSLPAHIPPGLRALLLAMLEPDPSRRPSAEEIAGNHTAAPPAAPPPAPQPAPQKELSFFGTLVQAVVLGLLLGLGYFFYAMQSAG